MKLLLVLLFTTLLGSQVHAQQIQFVVRDTTGKPLHGATISAKNVIGAVSDTAGVIRIIPIEKIVRLHLAGYLDMPLVLRDGMPDIIMHRSNEPLVPITRNYGSPLQLESLIYKKGNFDVTPSDSLTLGDTVLEKVTQIEIKSNCTLAGLAIRVMNSKERSYNQFVMTLYEDVANRPGKSMISDSVKSHCFAYFLAFNPFDYQIHLKPGRYFIGYKKKINKLYRSSKTNLYFDVYNYYDCKDSNGAPTYTRINNSEWKPLLMPKSKADKLKYYSYSYMLELVKHN